MRIMIYFDSIVPSGGIERVISNLIKHVFINDQVYIVTKDDGEPFYDIGHARHLTLDLNQNLDMSSRFSRIKTRIIMMIRVKSKLKDKIVDISPDIIYTATPLNGLEVIISGGENIVATEHASYDAPNIVYQLMKKIVYKKAEFLVVPTKIDAERYWKDGYNVKYIPHLNTYEAESVNFKTRKNILLNVGRMTSDKQQEELLRVWSLIIHQDRIQNWKLEIAGTGELEKRLQDVIEEENLQDFVIMNGQSVDIGEKYSSSKIFVLTSKMEGFGMVLLEAMSFGLPCITFNCPSGPAEIVKSDVNGLVVQLNDFLALRRAIVELISDQERLELLSNKTYDYIKSWPNSEIIEEWHNLLHKVN